LIVKLRKNADNTLTVRIGSQVEHISLDGKDKAQVYDAVKWAIISKGVNLDSVDLIELLNKAMA